MASPKGIFPDLQNPSIEEHALVYTEDPHYELSYIPYTIKGFWNEPVFSCRGRLLFCGCFSLRGWVSDEYPQPLNPDTNLTLNPKC